MIGTTARPDRAFSSDRAGVAERLLRRVAALVAALVVTFVVAMASATGAPAARAPVAIAVLDNTFAAMVHVAEAKGCFSAEGLDVKLERCKFGCTCLARLASGEVRYGTSADTPVMFSSVGGHEFTVLATLTTSSLENRIVVRTDRGIRLGGRGEALPPMRYFSVLFNLLAAPQAPGAGVGGDDDVRLLRALKRAEERIRRSPDEAIGIVASALKLERGAIAESWGNYEFRLHLGQALVDVLESQPRWAAREELVPARTPMPDFLDLLRPGPLRQVDARAVRLIQ